MPLRRIAAALLTTFWKLQQHEQGKQSGCCSREHRAVQGLSAALPAWHLIPAPVVAEFGLAQPMHDNQQHLHAHNRFSLGLKKHT